MYGNESKTALDEWLDFVYEEVKTFDLRQGLGCTIPNIWRCCAVFKTGELSIVYVKSHDRKHVEGCVICSNSFSGVRGDISADEFDWVRGLHPDVLSADLYVR